MRRHATQTILENTILFGGDSAGGTVKLFDRNTGNTQHALTASGNVLPATGSPGYNKGCLWQTLIGASAAVLLYTNIGTGDSCNFSAIAAVG